MPQTYVWDPATNTARLQEGDALGEPEDINPRMAGIGWLSGNTFIPADDPMNPQRLGSTGDITVTFLNNGPIDINSVIMPSSLNAPSQRRAAYGVTGTVDVLMPDGSTRQMTVDQASVSGYGERVYSYVDADGIQRFEAWVPGSPELASVESIFSASLRPATAGEAAERAMIGWIARNEMNIVNEIISQGGMDGPDGFVNDASGIIRALARLSSTDFTYNKQIRLPSPPGR